MPQNSNFRLTRGHRFLAKNGSYGYGAKLRWGSPRVHLGANGVPSGPKMGQSHKKLLCPKIRIFDYPVVIDFSQKMEVTVMAPNHGGDPLGSILGPMGSHWVQKLGQSHKKLPCPKIRIFDYPLGSILGPMGSHWVKKWVKAIKNHYARKFEFSTSPQSSIFRKKWKLRFWRRMTVGTPYGPSWGQWGSIG